VAGNRAAIGRRELFVWLAGILLANRLASQLFRLQADSAGGLGDAAASLLMANSVFYYLGWYAVLRLIFESSAEALSSKVDIAFVIFVAAVSVLSSNWIAWTSATAAGVFLLTAHRKDAGQLKAAGAVLLALAFNGFWGPLLFDIFAFELLRVDAAIVGSVLSASQPGMTWQETVIGVPDGHSVLIYGPCSSFHNISLGLLCWASVTKLARTAWIPSDIAVACAICATVIMLNAIRLYLMALSADHFAYWHGGFGAQLFSWVTTFTVLLMSLWGAFQRAGPIR
jgi:hypothetical protein